MSEAKFTKGPWNIAGKSAIVSVNTGFGICNMVSNEAIDKANAALIACAPEMYEMLTEIKHGFELLISESAISAMYLPAAHQQVDEINALLAEARGE